MKRSKLSAFIGVGRARLSTWLVLAGGVLSLPLGAGAVESDFGVTPILEATNGKARLRVQFVIPVKHVLYADALSFSLGDRRQKVGFHLPEPSVRNDRVGK